IRLLAQDDLAGGGGLAIAPAIGVDGVFVAAGGVEHFAVRRECQSRERRGLIEGLRHRAALRVDDLHALLAVAAQEDRGAVALGRERDGGGKATDLVRRRDGVEHHAGGQTGSEENCEDQTIHRAMIVHAPMAINPAPAMTRSTWGLTNRSICAPT